VKSITPKSAGLLPRRASVMSIDRIGIIAYIPDFYSRYSGLLSEDFYPSRTRMLMYTEKITHVGDNLS